MIAGHWKRLGLPPNLDSPEWEDALRLYAGLRVNRWILKTLLADTDALDAVSESFSLFAKWYHDGPPPLA